MRSKGLGALARAAAVVIAGVHLFPAIEHLTEWRAAPSWSEGWKGFGAVLAIAVLLFPDRSHRRLLGRSEVYRFGAWLTLVVVHLVPAGDHVPRFIASGTWADAWRGLGACLAIVWFTSRICNDASQRVFGTLRRLAVLAVASTLWVASWAGCGSSQASSSGGPNVTTADGGAPTSAGCLPCTTDQDCNGGTCTQLGADSYCAAPCPDGTECPPDRACTSANSVTGEQVSVCVSRSDVCGVTDVPDGGTRASGTCGSLAGPEVKAGCTSCPAGKSNCPPNGCYGGWWCNTDTDRCQAPPADCSASTGGLLDAGAPVTGTVNATGGAISRLLFAVVGDTRPPVIDDTKAYPTAIAKKIFSDIEAFSPRPAFVVSTGDYMFASTSGAEAGPQLDLYLGARSAFSGVVFPAMGNHECTGATASNCGGGTTNGVTNNFSSFVTKMLGPIQQTSPYYAVDIQALDNSWTAKFVFVAANAWTNAQGTWLTKTLSQDTTYTFIVRHESRNANTAPGVTPSEKIMAQHPYTLAIVGHTHTYEHLSGREVIIGNGGAPATGSKNYGFGVFQQRSDGAIQVDMIDYATGASDAQFRFAVNPDGSPAP